MCKRAVFGPLKSLKLISRKILITGNFWNFHTVYLFVQFIQLVRSLQDSPQVLGGGVINSLKLFSGFMSKEAFLGNGKGGNLLAGSIDRQLNSEIFAPSHSQPFVATQAWQVWSLGHHSLAESSLLILAQSSGLEITGSSASRVGAFLKFYVKSKLVLFFVKPIFTKTSTLI